MQIDPKQYGGAYRALCQAEAWIAGTLLMAMVLLIFGSGIARMFDMPINWATDLATCMFAWSCFLCADIAWRKDNLMSVELLTDKLPAGVRRLCGAINYTLIVAFLLYVIGAGTWLSWISRTRSFQGIPEVSYSWITASMPVGAALLLLTTVLKIHRSLRARTEAAC